MNCSYALCKNKVYMSYPSNACMDTPHGFCYVHYKKVLKCAHVNEIHDFYKNCAIRDNTKGSKGSLLK